MELNSAVPGAIDKMAGTNRLLGQQATVVVQVQVGITARVLQVTLVQEVSGNILKVTECLGNPGSLIHRGNTGVCKCGSNLQLDGGWTGEGDFGGQRIDHLNHTSRTRGRVAVRRLVIVADGVLTGNGWHYGVDDLQQGGIQHISL